MTLGGFALTNAASVPDSNAADGKGNAATVTVDNASIHYTLNATNPAKADTVVFNVTSSLVDFNPSSTGALQLVNAGSPTGGSTSQQWFKCTITPGAAASKAASVSCDLTKDVDGSTSASLFVADIDQFRAVVAD
jgi:hypothetical protein